MTGPRTHELKTWPSQFFALVSGVKLAEFRKNDRDYRVGDELVLREWIPGDSTPGCYTGSQVRAGVTHIVSGTETPFGIPPGYVMMSLHLERVSLNGPVRVEKSP